MTRLILKISFLFVLLILLSIQGSTGLEQENQIQFNQAQLKNKESSRNLKLNPDFGKISLYFIPNERQVDEGALFYAKASRYTLWLTKEGLVFDSMRRTKKESTNSNRLSPEDINNHKDYKYNRDVSRLVFVNANRSLEVIPVDVTEHKVNYFIGKDESKWRTDIQTSSAVLYKEVYPNIDLKVYGVEQQIEYDFVVKPEGEVSDIGFEYKDVEKTRIDKEGNLVVETEFGELEHTKPVCYQIIGGERVEIQAEFMKIGDNNYGFKVEDYNKNYELIIDPVVLVYSTYLGGSGGDYGNGLAVDSEGAAYVTGETWSTDFPTRNPIQGSYGGGGHDTFITKINASGSALVYSTYLGGSYSLGGSYLDNGGSDNGRGIAVDSEGAAYVTGETRSIDFPTQDPYQGSFGGRWTDAFITKISSSGSALVYSTYLGGLRWERGEAIAVDSEGAAYVTGGTGSVDFPTRNPIQGSYGGGGDAFITKINASGRKLIYSTYLGGSGGDSGGGIAVDSEGAAYVTGETRSIDFPTQDPYQGSFGGWRDTFITKINASGSALVYSTYLGGLRWERGEAIAVDSEGAAYVTGDTDSVDFPTQDPYQGSFGGGWCDTFITKINASGRKLIYSTYLGGSENDYGEAIAVDSEGAAYVTGWKRSIDFPTLNPIQGSNAGQYDAFITKLSFSTYSLEVKAGTGGTTDPSPGNYDICVGSEIMVKAIPNEGFGFSHWSGDATSQDNPVTVLMDRDKSIQANFVRQYALNISAGLGGTTDPIPGKHVYNTGTKVTIMGIPENDYRFSHWSGDIEGRTNPKTISMNSDKSVTANFIRIIYPPSSFSGKKFLNRSLSQAEYINVLSWQVNTNNENIQNYKIYTVDGQSWSLLVELNANTFEYWHRRVVKDKPYTYAIVAVNDESREGDPAYVTVQ